MSLSDIRATLQRAGEHCEAAGQEIAVPMESLDDAWNAILSLQSSSGELASIEANISRIRTTLDELRVQCHQLPDEITNFLATLF